MLWLKSIVELERLDLVFNSGARQLLTFLKNQAANDDKATKLGLPASGLPQLQAALKAVAEGSEEMLQMPKLQVTKGHASSRLSILGQHVKTFLDMSVSTEFQAVLEGHNEKFDPIVMLVRHCLTMRWPTQENLRRQREMEWQEQTQQPPFQRDLVSVAVPPTRLQSFAMSTRICITP